MIFRTLTEWKKRENKEKEKGKDNNKKKKYTNQQNHKDKQENYRTTTLEVRHIGPSTLCGGPAGLVLDIRVYLNPCCIVVCGSVYTYRSA